MQFSHYRLSKIFIVTVVSMFKPRLFVNFVKEQRETLFVCDFKDVNLIDFTLSDLCLIQLMNCVFLHAPIRMKRVL